MLRYNVLRYIVLRYFILRYIVLRFALRTNTGQKAYVTMIADGYKNGHSGDIER